MIDVYHASTISMTQSGEKKKTGKIGNGKGFCQFLCFLGACGGR
jgi:hypothetical protein